MFIDTYAGVDKVELFDKYLNIAKKLRSESFESLESFEYVCNTFKKSKKNPLHTS